MTEDSTDTKYLYHVYHGGDLFSSGRWSGDHHSLREALDSTDECQRVVGGAPFIVRERDGLRETLSPDGSWEKTD